MKKDTCCEKCSSGEPFAENYHKGCHHAACECHTPPASEPITETLKRVDEQIGGAVRRLGAEPASQYDKVADLADRTARAWADKVFAAPTPEKKEWEIQFDHMERNHGWLPEHKERSKDFIYRLLSQTRKETLEEVKGMRRKFWMDIPSSAVCRLSKVEVDTIRYDNEVRSHNDTVDAVTKLLNERT